MIKKCKARMESAAGIDDRRMPVRDGALGGEVDAHAHARPAEGEQAVRAAQLAAGRQAQHRARPPRVQQAVLRARGAGTSGGCRHLHAGLPHARAQLGAGGLA